MPSPALPAAALVLAVALAACTPKPGTDAPGGAAAPSTGKDTCGAAALQGYVGQRIDALNDVDLPEGARVLFPTTPATMDQREDRLNVKVGKDDKIADISCG